MCTIRAPTHEVAEAVHSDLNRTSNDIVYRTTTQSRKMQIPVLFLALAMVSAEEAEENTRLLLGARPQVTSQHSLTLSSSSGPLSPTGLLLSIFSSAAQSKPRPHTTSRPYPTTLHQSCTYWCATPENQFYCCEHGPTKPTLPPFGRPGCCPAVRPECPTTRVGPPETCSHDHACTRSPTDKCCFDRCLGRHVCKPAQPCYTF
ncbi:uncharacterized protein LOC125039681 [Penaeus chinensis]|uniref:uncharacterized protein LOC125039681 n=1 Tax=Penaeus chinensis TaxID=139456 RepID=UPI001FB80866|nr:uncharacterized protein LOC125039681 [Penaeus chinensis]